MDYLSIGLHNRITELGDELLGKASKTSGVCVHLNPIYVFNGLRRGVRDSGRLNADALQQTRRARVTDSQKHNP